MLQALAPHLPIAPPQSLYLAITQLQHGSCIFQFQCPTVDSPHYPHPLQLTAAHARPHSTRPPVAGGLSLRGHFYSVREGTLSKSFNRPISLASLACQDLIEMSPSLTD